MKFDMKPTDRAFLQLAEKVAAGKGTSKDQAELDSMMKQNPEFRVEFTEFQRNLHDEQTAEFWAVAVRVLVGAATKDEIRRIESLKTDDPRRWEKYQDALEFLNGMAARPEIMKNAKPRLMPAHLRKELLGDLSSKKRLPK